eukprot:jgi/Tetstr1/445688/TSEL_003492.t1
MHIEATVPLSGMDRWLVSPTEELAIAVTRTLEYRCNMGQVGQTRIMDVQQILVDAYLDPEACPHSFNLTPAGPRREAAIIRIHLLEQHPEHPECLRVRNVRAIEPGEIAPRRAPFHNRMHANNVGRAKTRKRRPELLRAPAPGEEQAVLFTLVTLDAHGSGWLGLKTTQNDPRTDSASRAVSQLRRLHDRRDLQLERRERVTTSLRAARPPRLPARTGTILEEDLLGLDENLVAASLLPAAAAVSDPTMVVLTAI